MINNDRFFNHSKLSPQGKGVTGFYNFDNTLSSESIENGSDSLLVVNFYIDLGLF
jgi:hypothetical protein